MTMSVHPAFAAGQLRLSATYQVLHAQGLLRAADLALVSIANLFQSDKSDHINDLIIHTVLNRKIDRVAGLRALFTTDAVGNLAHDSFKYPTRVLDLNKRDYIQNALGLKENDIYIGDPIKASFFNLGSLPLSRPIFNHKGYIKGVAVALIAPDSLLMRQKICKKCVVSIFKTTGRKVTSFPAAVANQPDIQAMMKSFPENQVVDIVINKHPTQTVWTKFPDYDLVLMYSKFN